MALFKAGEAIPNHSFIPRELISDEPWGEVWRARHPHGGSILIVGYTMPEGDAMFEESLPTLRKWKEVAGVHAPHLLKIIEISESAIPYLIVEDPDGKTWRETVKDLQEPMPLEEQAAMATSVLDAISEAESHDIAPIGVSPDTIFRVARSASVWRLLPIAPKSKLAHYMIREGRYFPRQVTVAEKPSAIHADCYSLAWIWFEGMRHDFDAPWPEAADAIPFPKLALILESTMSPKAGFANDPTILKKSIDQWLSIGVEQDRKAYEAELKKHAQSGFRKFWSQRKGVIGRFFGAFLVVGSILGGLGGYAVAEINSSNAAKAFRFVDTDLTKAYLDALAAGNPSRAQDMTAMLAREQSREAAALIDKMKEDGVITGFDHAETTFAGASGSRVANAVLFDSANVPFATLRLSLFQDRSYHWSIVDVYFTQTRFQ